jgi:hypothetical protein
MMTDPKTNQHQAYRGSLRDGPGGRLADGEAKHGVVGGADGKAGHSRCLPAVFSAFGTAGRPPVSNPTHKSASMSLEGYPYRKRTKHIEIAYHFVCDEVASGEIAVIYIQIEDMIANILAKPLPPLKHANHVQTMNLLQLPSPITESQE